jgi:hypothetical protein
LISSPAGDQVARLEWKWFWKGAARPCQTERLWRPFSASFPFSSAPFQDERFSPSSSPRPWCRILVFWPSRFACFPAPTTGDPKLKGALQTALVGSLAAAVAYVIAKFIA